MLKTILIILHFYGTDSTSLTQEFDTPQACEAVKQQFVAWKEGKTRISHNNIFITCAPKSSSLPTK